MIYEQPLNEDTRLLLRLEYLFNQLDHYTQLIRDDHQALRTILEILSALDRNNLKNRFLQNLMQYQQMLSPLKQATEVDLQKLTNLLEQIEQLSNELYLSQKKIGQNLRENEFLNTIQQRLYIPAGLCGSNLPVYQLWLAQDPELRKNQLAEWQAELILVKKIVMLSLKLIRESNIFKSCIAIHGFYQCNLDPNLAYQIICISLDRSHNLYPEISLGRYRLAIHFFHLDSGNSHRQSSQDVEFQLSCCRL